MSVLLAARTAAGFGSDFGAGLRLTFGIADACRPGAAGVARQLRDEPALSNCRVKGKCADRPSDDRREERSGNAVLSAVGAVGIGRGRAASVLTLWFSQKPSGHSDTVPCCGVGSPTDRHAPTANR